MNRLALILASACLIFGTTASAADFGADRHVARGLECASCHGPDMKNPETPDENTCLKCHNRDQIAEKTNSRLNPNPHKAPHNGDCTPPAARAGGKLLRSVPQVRLQGEALRASRAV